MAREDADRIVLSVIIASLEDWLDCFGDPLYAGYVMPARMSGKASYPWDEIAPGDTDELIKRIDEMTGE